MRNFVFFILAVYFFHFSSASFATGESAEVYWQTKADRSQLGRSSEWRRILLYVPHWIGGQRSLADQDEFFLSDNGGSDPVTELRSTIKAFFAPWPGDANNHPICRFPMRLKFIENSLHEAFPSALKPHCGNYQMWRSEHQVNGLSLVFASNYLNNPASLYGHTFIRLHRKRDDGSGSSALLDYAVNFAANPTTTNPILYPLFGLTGRFYGTFSLLPYYVKVQEYNNSESRDLFEYPVAFTSDEIDNFMAILWEAGPYGIRYWYIDENCAYVLLAMLEAAKPSLDVTEGFLGVVSPKDTLLALRDSRVLGTPIRRPSTITKFNVRRADLSPAEVDLIKRQTKENALLPEIKNSDPQAKSRMLDALLEWIAWDEKLAGNRVAEKHAALWKESLSERSKLGSTSTQLDFSKAPTSPPEEGHKSHRSYLAFRHINHQPSEVMFGLRLTLHDFNSPPAGYSPEQETTMGDFQAVSHQNKDHKTIVELERFTWVRIFSAPAYDSLLPSWAWTLTAQHQRMWGYGQLGERDSWLTHKIEGGGGLAWGSTSKTTRAWVIPVVVAGHLFPKVSPALHAGFGLRSGVSADPHPEWRLICGADLDRWYTTSETLSLRDVYASASWLHHRETEFRLAIRSRSMTDGDNPSTSAELLWMTYF